MPAADALVLKPEDVHVQSLHLNPESKRYSAYNSDPGTEIPRLIMGLTSLYPAAIPNMTVPVPAESLLTFMWGWTVTLASGLFSLVKRLPPLAIQCGLCIHDGDH
jgi:hypothetical protein